MKALTKQEYEINHKSPSQLVFYETEKDLCHIASLHLAEYIKDNITVLEKLLHLKDSDVIETENKDGVFYIVKHKWEIEPKEI
jgi:phage terminase large subunit GpA-like protein